MAPVDSSSSPSTASFSFRATSQRFLTKCNSLKDLSASEIPYMPPRLSSPNLSDILFASPSHCSYPTKHADLMKAVHRCVFSALKKDGQILSIAVSNGLVYTGSEANSIRVWKLPELTECGQLKTKACMVVALIVSNDTVIAAYGDGKMRVWRRIWGRVVRHTRLATIPNTGGLVRSYIAGRDKTMKHLGPITALAINDSEGVLYSASVDKTVKLWRISDLKCIETIKAHPAPINALVVADDVLYTASDDATIKVWRRNYGSNRTHSLTVTLSAKHSPVKTLALTSDGALLYGGCNDGYIHFWTKGWILSQLQYGGALQGHTHSVMCLATVANYVVSGSADCTSRVWTRDQDGHHRCVAVLVSHGGPVRCVTAIRSCLDEKDAGNCTVCTGNVDGVLKIWSVSMNNACPCSQNGVEYF